MIKLTKLEISQLRQLVDSPQWETVKRIADLLMQNIQNAPVNNSAEWVFLYDSILANGKIAGIKELLYEIDKLTEND